MEPRKNVIALKFQLIPFHGIFCELQFYFRLFPSKNPLAVTQLLHYSYREVIFYATIHINNTLSQSTFFVAHNDDVVCPHTYICTFIIAIVPRFRHL